MAEELRPYTEEDMKIQQVPWLQEYLDMETNYTELSLQKIEDTPKGQTSVPLHDYRELFQEDQSANKQAGRWKRKTVIMTGDPGIGKTTMCKKVVWDWAKGLFTMFTVVFLISMQMIKPGDLIENIILQQTPTLEGLGISEKRLKRFLDCFGDRCLIVLDGYDEFVAGNKENVDLTKVLAGRKFLNCSLLLTSRPHSVEQIKVHFRSYVRVQGFSQENAREFASSVLTNQDQLSLVMDIQCINITSHLKEGDSLHASPMLLIFVCILANNNEINLVRKETTLGEIYFRLLRWVYRKFTFRKNIDFKQSEFLNTLRCLGKIATDTWETGNYLHQEREIIKIVGRNAFEYGLLIGYKDRRLLKDETADIFLSYPHRSIEEFLTAFFYVVSANDGLSRMRKNDPWLIGHPLIFQFCLWILLSGEEYIHLNRKDDIICKLEDFFLYFLNHCQLDFREFPLFIKTFDIQHALDINNELALNFIRRVLQKCSNTKHLTFNAGSTLEWILTANPRIFDNVNSIALVLDSSLTQRPLEIDSLYVDTSKLFHITIYNVTLYISLLQKVLEYFDRPASVSLPSMLPADIDLSKVLHANIEKVKMETIGIVGKLKISAFHDLPKCSSMTHLCLSNLKIHENTFNSLSEAQKAGYLPLLSHLSFVECGSDVRGNLGKLFQSQWRQLIELVLSRCEIGLSDLGVLCGDYLPNLKSLTLFLGQKTDNQEVNKRATFVKLQQKTRLRNIRRLMRLPLIRMHLQDIDAETLRYIIKFLNTSTEISIEDLDVSICKYGTDQQLLCDLPILNAPQLSNFTLTRFIRSRAQIEFLTKCPFLPDLRKLDISHSSGLMENLSFLLFCCFNGLSSLVLKNCKLVTNDLRSLAVINLEGKLPELSLLDISHNESLSGETCHLYERSSTWKRLVSLNVEHCGTAALSKMSELNSKYLPLLHDLRCSIGKEHKILPLGDTCRWECLRTLTISTEDDNDCCQLLGSLVNLVDRNLLPSLTSILLVNYSCSAIKKGIGIEFRKKLREANISVNTFTYYAPEHLLRETD